MTKKSFIKLIKKSAFLFASLFLLLIVFLIIKRNINPLSQLKDDIGNVSSKVLNVKQINNLHGETRNYKEIELFDSQSLQKVRLSISYPDTLSNDLPVLFILGGLNDGETYLNLIVNHGQNIIIGFHYPNNKPYWEDQLTSSKIISVRNSILSVPNQVSIALKWLYHEKYVDINRLNFLGYSLGAIFAPSVINIANENGFQFYTAAIVYGSSDLQFLIKENLKIKNEIISNSIAWFISSSIYPIEPKEHIKDLNGNFLIINGIYDTKIPINIAKQTQELYPITKEIINLPEKHMHPKRKDLTSKLVKICFDWLLDKKAINEYKLRNK